MAQFLRFFFSSLFKGMLYLDMHALPLSPTICFCMFLSLLTKLLASVSAGWKHLCAHCLKALHRVDAPAL